jgi:hypothetical protein
VGSSNCDADELFEVTVAFLVVECLVAMVPIRTPIARMRTAATSLFDEKNFTYGLLWNQDAILAKP